MICLFWILQAELEAARSSHMEEIARVKEDAAQSVVVAEARGRRSGLFHNSCSSRFYQLHMLPPVSRAIELVC